MAVTLSGSNVKTLCILLLLMLLCLSGCGEPNSFEDGLRENEPTEAAQMELRISTLEDKLQAKDEKIASLEEKLHDAEIRIGFLEEEIGCYRDFADAFLDKIDKEDMEKYAYKLWKYSLLIGKEPFDGWEPFPLHGEAEVAGSNLKIMLSEEQPPYPILPTNIFNSGRIGEIGECGHFFEHLEITSSYPYELQGAAGTVVDNAIYVFKDVPKGAEIEITVTLELQERLGLETANLRVKVK